MSVSESSGLYVDSFACEHLARKVKGLRGRDFLFVEGGGARSGRRRRRYIIGIIGESFEEALGDEHLCEKFKMRKSRRCGDVG